MHNKHAAYMGAADKGIALVSVIAHLRNIMWYIMWPVVKDYLEHDWLILIYLNAYCNVLCRASLIVEILGTFNVRLIVKWFPMPVCCKVTGY